MTEPLPTDARSLLRAARAIWDASPDLARDASRAWRGGFGSGAAWMGRAMAVVRHRRLPGRPRRFGAFGVAKYSLAVAAALLFLAGVAAVGRPGLGVGAILVFYAVEAQGVFLFPLLLDGSARPIRDSLCRTRQAGGRFG